MKRVLTFSVVLLMGVVLGRFSDTGLVEAGLVEAAIGGGAGPVGARNGDVNGDQVVDLSDASHLLNWLFLGGPPLVSCPGAPPGGGDGVVGLPDTGQTLCLKVQPEIGDLDRSVPCDEAACPGQDGFYDTGCSPDRRFTGTRAAGIRDNCTGLMWMGSTADVRTADNRLSWCDALKFCEDLTFAGHDDWRLPNIRELQSIVDYGVERPSIDSRFTSESKAYWSSTANLAGFAWNVNFINGGTGTSTTSSVFHVRAVRTVE
jgi:hypothetical protein